MEDALRDDLVEIELNLDENTIKVLESRSKFLGVTKEELVVNILEEEFNNEIIEKTKQGKVDSPPKVSTG